MKRTVKYILSVLTAIVVFGSLYGCSGDDAKQISEIEKLEDNGYNEIIEEVDEVKETDGKVTGETTARRKKRHRGLQVQRRIAA